MADIPADAVHRRDAPPRLFVADAFETAAELAAREAELFD
jgi:hypothetical protein